MNAKTALAMTTCLTAILIASAPAVAAPISENAVAQDIAPPTQANAAAMTKTERRRARAAERRRLKALKVARASGADSATYKGPEGNDIVVVGLRASLKTARDKKRNAKQIVDSVSAEDVGKLPDNNVPEALSRITGVGIDRVHGEGQNITIRGLSDIQTTVNGNEVSGSSHAGTGVEYGSKPSRSATLADIPAELLKSVEVYKTRTADQVEGGIAGTVNVELRRPLDLKKGLTVAGSFREVNNSNGNTWSPYASLLVGEHWNTGIGEMGFLLNGSYTNNKYVETYIFSESPDAPCRYFPGSNNCQSLLAASGLTAAQGAALVIPYRVSYGVDTGEVKRPSLNAAFQWKPNDHLDFVLEGSWFGTRENRGSDTERVIVRDDSSNYSNVKFVDQNGTPVVQSLTVNSTVPNGINGGVESYYGTTASNNYNTNFEVHWHSDKVQINASTQYNWSDSSYYGINQLIRLKDDTQVSTDFNSSSVPGGGPSLTFPLNDISNPSQYQLFQVHDQFGGDKNHMLAGQVDITVNTSDTGFFRSLQTGFRMTDRYDVNTYGYRDGLFDTVTRPSLSSIPGVGLVTSTPVIPGIAAPTWYHLDGKQLLANFDQVRQYLVANGIQYGDFSTVLPPSDNGSEFVVKEHTWAAYGQFNYGFKAAGIPIDGVVGARLTNTWGSNTSTQYRFNCNADLSVCDTTTQLVTTPGNYLDVLPSANMVIHFTPKLQLRFAYTYNVQRPDFASLSSFIYYDATQINNANSYVYSGNPNLKPVRETNYDASLEYYFGRAGQISLGGFIKNQTGFIYYTTEQELVPVLGNTLHFVSKPRNAGPGQVKGIEFAAQSFADFIPGFWRNFGASVNLTYIPDSRLDLSGITATTFAVTDLGSAPYTSKLTSNVALYYDTPVFSARVAFNYRSKYNDGVDGTNPQWTTVVRDRTRLDAAINYTPFKFVTLSLEGSNLTRSYDHRFYGAFSSLPVGVRVEGRTIQLGARFRL